MNNLLWALKFLTIIPIGRGDKGARNGFRPVVCWFPVVGLCIGVFLSLFFVLFSLFFPLHMVHALIILIYIIITGAFHLDGFADTCDGIWGGWNKEKRLEIMRDSRIGSFGVIGLICLLGLKYMSLMSIGEMHTSHHSFFYICAEYISCSFSPARMNVCIALIVMPVVGRWGQVCAAGLSAYARSEPGTGRFISDATTVKHVIFISLIPLFLYWFFYNLAGIMLFAIISIFSLIWIWYIKKKIGGMTGDTLGATNEVSELLSLLSLLAFNNTLYY
ncbi:MAG: adenosylcobinamide-GDP ribazoletransferase [wastewater metagenome]|nr:adenosylcobinamide-GDP ribazoletransferase [Candidatus Loosdrechtia aerotolerans]